MYNQTYDSPVQREHNQQWEVTKARLRRTKSSQRLKRRKKKEKKEKKEKKSKRKADDIAEDTSLSPTGKERSGGSDGKNKAQKTSADSSAPSESKKRSDSLISNEGRRSRTRSMSFNEDRAKIDASQSPEDFRAEHQIVVMGKNESKTSELECPAPMMTFDSTPYAPPIRRSLELAGFSNPTPTQAQCWPIALEGRDVITIAKTGSGKTCGFLLPAFHRLLNNSKGRRRGPPGILVLAPTESWRAKLKKSASNLVVHPTSVRLAPMVGPLKACKFVRSNKALK